MPFLVPLVAGAIGLGATATFALEIGVAVGLTFLAKKLRPKTKSAESAQAERGVQVGLQISTNPPRQVIIGECATGGSLVYWQLSGTDNSTLQMVIALADHECVSLQSVIVNGKPRAWDTGTTEVAGFSGKLKVRFHSGAIGQAYDSIVGAASGGRWTSNEKGSGVCYAVAEMIYDEEVFPEGIPDLSFIVRGVRLYDPRTGTTNYSNNSAVAVYNILRGITVGGEPLLGMNVPTSAIRLSEAQAAANACDEAVARKAGGTEDRYRCNVILDTTQSNRDIIETILASMAGEVIESGGVYRIMAGVAQSPVAAITDDDLITSEPFLVRPKRGRNEIVNAVHGSYTDPARGYEAVPLPPRTSSTDEDLDGGIRLAQSFDLRAVTSRSQAQRIMEVERRRARRMASATMRIRARWFVLEPGDWITFTSNRRGYSSKTFVVHSASGARDLTSDIVLLETDDQIDDWSTSLEIDDDQVVDLASGGPNLSFVSGVILQNVTITAAGAVQRPGLNIQWTPITDTTVTELEIEYRRVGDTLALKTPQVLDPSTGQYTWTTGVQSGVIYEARIRPRTRPRRSVTWSSWVAVAANSVNQVVAVAAYAETVNPAGLPPAILSAQERFELSLIFETDEVLGSLSNAVEETRRSAEKAHSAVVDAIISNQENSARVAIETRERLEADSSLASQITSVVANFNNANATITQSLQSLASVDQTLASSIDTLSTTVEGNTAQVTVIAASIDGLGAKFGVAVSANGEVLGLVQLDASAVAGSTFTVVADNFKVALPGISGGDAVPVFAIQNVNGVAKLAFRGDMFADGTITAQKLNVSTLSALSANLGVVTAGLIRNTANTLRFDLPAMRLYRADGTAEINLSSKTIRFSA